MTVFDDIRIVSPYDVELSLPERMGIARFGIIEGIGAALAAIGGSIGGAATSGLGALGIGTETAAGIGGAIGTGAEGALVGTGLGALTSAITGQPIGKGAEMGALGGFATGAIAPSLFGTSGAAGGGASSAAGTAAPASVAPATPLSPDTGAASPLTPATTTPLGSSVPGAVGAGAASGTPTLAGSQLSSATAASTPPITGNIGTTPGGGAAAGADAFSPQITPSGVPAANLVSTVPNVGTDTTGGTLGFLKNNANWLVPAAGLGVQALRGMQEPPGFQQLQALAGQEAGQAGRLESYLETGQLPSGLQAQVNIATNAAKANIRSMYAQRGMSGSSAEAEDLANVDSTAATQAGQMALQLYNSGVSEANMGAQLTEALMNVTLQQDQNLSNAIGNFVSAMAGGQQPLRAIYI